MAEVFYITQTEFIPGRWSNGCAGHDTMLEAIGCRDHMAAVARSSPANCLFLFHTDHIPPMRIAKMTMTEEVLEEYPAETLP